VVIALHKYMLSAFKWNFHLALTYKVFVNNKSLCLLFQNELWLWLWKCKSSFEKKNRK